MFPFKRKTASDTSTSPELTEEERQRRKKFIIYPLMFLLFAGSMWLIFAPSEKEEGKHCHYLHFTILPQIFTIQIKTTVDRRHLMNEK